MRIRWDELGTRFYKRGVDRGVLYTYSGGDYIDGVPWNGLTEVSPKRDGRDKEVLYSGDAVADVRFSEEEPGGSIKAYMYPDEFEACVGASKIFEGMIANQQDYRSFGLSYRTYIGNDTEGTGYGYVINLVYGAVVTSVTESTKTLDKSANIEQMSWDYMTIPVDVPDFGPVSLVQIDSTKFSSESLSELEDILYGTADTAPRLPSVEELIELFTPEPDPGDDDTYPSEELYPSEYRFPADVTYLLKNTPDNFRNATINGSTGANGAASPNRVRSVKAVPVRSGHRVVIEATTGYAFWVYKYDENGDYIGYEPASAVNKYTVAASDTEYSIRFVVRRTDNAAFNASDVGTTWRIDATMIV